MSLYNLLTILALIGSLILVFQFRPVAAPIVALFCSGLEVLLAFHVVHISVAHVPLGIVFACGLILAGAYTHWRASSKLMVSCATVVTVVGAVQLFSALR